MKAYSRQADFKPVSCSLRASLPQTRHSSVDTLLKEFRTCSRRLQISLETHASESQILERLYYKGKNQHRGALFWRRVAEVRRYSGRLSGTHVEDVVKTLRFSFFGEGVHDNPKLAKGSWTHFPDHPSMLFTVERLSATSVLVKKMHTRLVDAYRFFTLAMQSGAFLQLVLTLQAIVSRLGTICLEVLEALQATSKSIQNILEVLFAPEARQAVDVMGGGAPISTVSMGNVTESGTERHADLSTALTQMVPNNPSTTTTTESPLFSSTVVRRTVIKATSTSREIPEGKMHRRENKKVTKKRISKNEIDEIFGF